MNKKVESLNSWDKARVEVKNDKGKLGDPINYCMKVRSQGKWMSLSPTAGGREELTRFGGINGKTWWGKDMLLNTNRKDVRKRKFTSPNFGGSPQEGP